MIELWSERGETGGNVTQALPIGQLSKRHTKELIPAGECPDTVMTVMTLDRPTETMHRNEVH